MPAVERWAPIGLSVLLHAILVGVLVYGYLQFRKPPPPISALAIDATVVSQATLDAARRPAPTPAPPAPVTVPPPEQTLPPPPDTAAQEAAAQAEAAHQEAAQAAQAAQEKAAAKRAADQLAARQEAAEAAERQAAQEKASAARAAQEKVAKARAEHEAQLRAKAAEELASRRATEQAQAQARAAAAARLQAAANQADLQRSIAAEERLDAVRSSGALAGWQAQITARIQRAWIRPPSAKAGIQCILYVTQVPGGEVTDVKLGPCNGDEAVKQSIQDAAYRASPLPPPPDPSLFERQLEITFRPTE